MTQVMDERNARIQRQHLERAAYVYVRQSSPRQVIEHLESQRRQYASRGLGGHRGAWPPNALWVIDEDQGKSASSAKTRRGCAFDRSGRPVSGGDRDRA